ncbi:MULTISPECIES: heavy metal translocating P-type ATPase [Leptolyngbya]|uniref:heavy metal translocating P-type ATPase n=1 Tax=Leptolyngbya TaxID=47251 RepID=UPI0016884C9D|nr:heavy metal translocating P-type ATPase [Leptolyngbya sp. FACHB-1624]MBD1854810.1 heavy metal translocating P-type ATPase [Leptolyngbya sp. FACHB-1624]
MLNVPRLLQNHSDALAAIICAIFVLLSTLALHLNWIGFALLLLPIAYGVGGFESAREGLTTLWQEKELDVDLLMIVAALGAAGLGLWRQEYFLIIDGAVLILIFAISGALEGYAMQRTERSIRSLMSLTPDTASVIRQGQEKRIAISHLQVGDEIIVRPGELIPTDGVIVEGYSTINQAAITGESLPVEKTIDNEVFAGTLNGAGALRLKLVQPPESSLIQRIVRLVEQAQTEAPPSQQFIERFEKQYAKVIVGLGLVLAIAPPFLFNWSWETTIYRALIFLVVASPCALMAAIMPTLLSGIANGARQGILFKNGGQLEKIGQVSAIAFDKTGTLTTGELKVVKVAAMEGYSDDEVLELAAALEVYSEHPIGVAIVEAAKQQSPTWCIKNIQAEPGQGIIGQVSDQTVRVGNLKFIERAISKQSDRLIQDSLQVQKDGNTIVYVAIENRMIGWIAIADTIRPEALSAIAQLKQLGIQSIVMLTGDNLATANRIAQTLGIDQVYAELLPENKLQIIRQLQGSNQSVAMVGDGINDAPALAQATVGIAMGIAGSDVALETADIILMSDRLSKLVTAIQLGRRSQIVIKQNIIFALSFIVLLLITNFGGKISLPLGVIGHEGSTVLVILSGLRLLKH